MRIFYAADTSPNASFASNLWRNNLCLPLMDLGHEVVEFDYDLRETFLHVDTSDPAQKTFIKRNRPKVTADLLQQIRRAHAEKAIDLFFSYFYDACILPEAVEKIRAMGIKTVNWYCNGSYQLHLVREISPHYDWCLVPEKFRLKDYEAIGARPIYCQEAANPTIYKHYDLSQEFDVTFIGQAYGERPSYIDYLVRQGIDVRVWGYGWQAPSQTVGGETVGIFERLSRAGRKLLSPVGRAVIRRDILRSLNVGVQAGLPEHVLGGLLSDEEMIRMYSRSKINLGFSVCGSTHETEEKILQVRLRDFEIPMSGGFYMVEYMEELEEFYEIGKEIVCYTGPEDLAQKIKYYLANDAERETIRRAGYERCKRDHSWQQRFEMAFQMMGL